MFINKINNVFQQKTNFKSYHHEKNDCGVDLMRFYYPHDYNNEKAEISFYTVKKNPAEFTGYEISKEPFKTLEFGKDGIALNLDREPAIKDVFAYQIKINGKPVKDTGINVGDYILVSRKGFKPMNAGGKGYLTMHDIHMPGAFYKGFASKNPGEIGFDEARQLSAEKTKRTFSNKLGGSLAGIQKDIPELKKNKIDVLYATPVAGGDNVAYHGYWNKNNFQISGHVGTLENYISTMQDLFQAGIKFVFDGTFTSEGFEGVNFQRALICNETDPLTRHMFLIADQVSLGVIPRNDKTFRMRFINAPVNYTQNEDGTIDITKNLHYDSSKETYLETYSVHDESDKLEVNTYQDTAVKYTFEVLDPDVYTNKLKELQKYNNIAETPIIIESLEGVRKLDVLSYVKLDNVTKGIYLWDDQSGMVRRRHDNSKYDREVVDSINNEDKKEDKQYWLEKAVFANKDMDYKAAKYWTGVSKDAILLKAATILKNASTFDEIEDLIKRGELSEKVRLSEKAIANIKTGWYKLEPKCVLAKDDITIKALMRFPVEALDVAENTSLVLASPYLTNYATSKESSNMTRFELYKNDNPHLIKPYTETYQKMDEIFTEFLKDFTDEIINGLNEKSQEKLLDKDGNYTEYGEYVVGIIGSQITRYALLKAIAGSNFEAKMDSKGIIHYNLELIKNETSLKSLGITTTNAKHRAEALIATIKAGLNNINSEDVKTLVDSYSQQLEGTNAISFRLAEAMYKSSALGLTWRLDAIKDTMSVSAIKDRHEAFPEVMDDLIDYCDNLVKAIKSENPHSMTTAEITNIDDLMRATYDTMDFTSIKEADGKFKEYNDAMIQLFNETGITTEAGYSYFFTGLINCLSKDFENGNSQHDIGALRNNLINLLSTRSPDYIKNLMNFIGNHDKARAIHNLALDMTRYHANFSPYNHDGSYNPEQGKYARETALQLLSGVDSVTDMPLEFRLNVNNPDYFNTVSRKSLAMAALLNDCINETLAGFVSQDEMKYLKQALSQLMDGAYLDKIDLVSRQTIKHPELTSFDGAFRKIIDLAIQNHGLNISDDEKENLVKSVSEEANKDSNVYKHLVEGGFDLQDKNVHLSKTNRAKAGYILKDDSSAALPDSDLIEASLYTICLATILKDAFIDKVDANHPARNPIIEAFKDFGYIYNKKKIAETSTPFPYDQSDSLAMRKNGFGKMQIDEAIIMLIEQAEYLARKDGKLGKDEHFISAEEIEARLYANAIEPAVQKFGTAVSCLMGLPGIGTIFAGDELGATGGEEKTKNLDAQCRNTRKISQLKDGIFKDLRLRIKGFVEKASDIMNRPGLEALRDGIPYVLYSSSDNDTLAILYQKANNYAISIMNLGQVHHENRYDYHQAMNVNRDREDFFGPNGYHKANSINPDNRFVPVQIAKELEYLSLPENINLPIGTRFINSIEGLMDTFIVKEGRKIVRESGGNIKIDGLTARNGVMLLKPIFKGRNLNKQYHIAPQNYNIPKNITNGEKLSLIAK